MSEIYLMMNKPAGYVCSAASDSHKTVYELLPPDLQSLVKNAKRGHRLHTIGRLDAATTGLLLFTTDGMFSHKIAASGGPSRASGTTGISKIYHATLKQEVSPAEQAQYIKLASQGLTLPPEKKAPEQQAAPATLTFIDNFNCRITVTEGKFHEVRRIFRALGNEVKELKRIAIGKLSLPDSLKPGEYTDFSPEQILF